MVHTHHRSVRPAALREEKAWLWRGRGTSSYLLPCSIFWNVKYVNKNNSEQKTVIILKERDARLTKLWRMQRAQWTSLHVRDA